MRQQIKKNILYIALVQATTATVISLYFSNILRFPPCDLCWYQRIAMYPLVPLLVVGILKKDKNLPLYVLPLSIFGGVVAFYQYLLQMGVVPSTVASCTFGVSCSIRYIDFLGFITLPLLSLAAFAIIIGCMVLYSKSNSRV